MQIRFIKMHPDATAPVRATPDSAGADLVAVSDPTETEKYIQYNTGIAVEIPQGYVGLLFPRSSVSNYDLSMANCVGVIDSDYRGEIMLRFRKTRKNIISVDKDGNELERIYEAKVYKAGERCGQLVIVPYVQTEFVESQSLDNTVRGAGAYGSTGN